MTQQFLGMVSEPSLSKKQTASGTEQQSTVRILDRRLLEYLQQKVSFSNPL
mgnify:CR=1 FL=1